MSKERKDGLFIDNMVYMIDEKKPGFPIQYRFIQMVAILIGGWGSIGVLLDSIPIPISYYKVYLAIILSAGIIFGLCLIPSLNIVKLFFGLLFYGLFLFSRLEELKNGFYISENVVFMRLSNYYGFPSVTYVADYTRGEKDCTLLVIMIVIPLITLITVAIVRNRLSNIAGMILFLPIILSFTFGLIPAERYLITYLAAVLYLSRSAFTNRKSTTPEQKQLLHRINSKAAIYICLISLVLFFLIKVFISKDQYDNFTNIEETKKSIQTSMSRIKFDDISERMNNFHLFSSGQSVGGLSGGQLANVGTVEYSESEQLVVTAPYNSIFGGLYLKGYVGSDYTGHSWEGHSKEIDKEYKALLKVMPVEQFSPINQVAQGMKVKGAIDISERKIVIPIDEIMIKYKKANKNFFYAPYFTDFSVRKDISYNQDLYAVPKKRQVSYNIAYYNEMLVSYQESNSDTTDNQQTPDIDQVALDNFNREEKLYRDFVYSAYTQLPKEGLDRLKEEFSRYNDGDISTNNMEDITRKILIVKDYLEENTSYTLSPGKLPPGKDYVEYFLFENKKGYCAHYASAATLMLRAMGVPARFVEGYVILPTDVDRSIDKDQKILINNRVASPNVEIQISVKDYNAHAWVEIYADGIGWILQDFTPASQFGYAAMEKAKKDKEESNNTPTKIPLNQQNNENQNKVSTPTPVITKVAAPNNTTGTSGKGGKATLDKLTTHNTIVFAIITLLFVAIIASLTFFLVFRKKNQNIWNRNRRAIVLYARAEKILTACHGMSKRGDRLEDNVEYVKQHCTYIEQEVFSNCMDIVRKARFSNVKISQAELGQLEIMQRHLYEKAYKDSSLLKKLQLSLIHNLGDI